MNMNHFSICHWNSCLVTEESEMTNKHRYYRFCSKIFCIRGFFLLQICYNKGYILTTLDAFDWDTIVLMMVSRALFNTTVYWCVQGTYTSIIGREAENYFTVSIAICLKSRVVGLYAIYRQWNFFSTDDFTYSFA